MQEQVAKLRDVPDIIVATPSRLVQHLKEGLCCSAFCYPVVGFNLYWRFASQAVSH